MRWLSRMRRVKVKLKWLKIWINNMPIFAWRGVCTVVRFTVQRLKSILTQK